MTMATWLADVLRGAALKVVEEPGWKTRGLGEMADIKGVILHHTGSNPKGGDHPALNLIIHGRAAGPGTTALPGPLSHLVLARDGTFHVVAAGRTNHAGKGFWHGLTTGNSSFLGIEAENDGIGEIWPPAQMDAYERGVAAILEHIGADAVMAVGHKEWALPKGRKVDPSFDMVHFRDDLESLMAGVPLGGALPTTVHPSRAMLRKGDMGESVKQLQKLLGINADGNFGPMTESAVKLFQQNHGLAIDGRVGPKTWAALGVR